MASLLGYRARSRLTKPALSGAFGPDWARCKVNEPSGPNVHCAECDALWLPTDEERWRAYLTDDEPAEVVFYCPDCAGREFD